MEKHSKAIWETYIKVTVYRSTIPAHCLPYTSLYLCIPRVLQSIWYFLQPNLDILFKTLHHNWKPSIWGRLAWCVDVLTSMGKFDRQCCLSNLTSQVKLAVATKYHDCGMCKSPSGCRLYFEGVVKLCLNHLFLPPPWHLHKQGFKVLDEILISCRLLFLICGRCFVFLIFPRFFSPLLRWQHSLYCIYGGAAMSP